MSGGSLLTFLYGALTLAAAVAGLCFLRLWSSSRDRLFVFLVAGFWTLGVNWAALAFLAAAGEHRVAVYLIRLLAFVLIIVGVVDKNRRASRA